MQTQIKQHRFNTIENITATLLFLMALALASNLLGSHKSTIPSYKAKPAVVKQCLSSSNTKERADNQKGNRLLRIAVVTFSILVVMLLIVSWLTDRSFVGIIACTGEYMKRDHHMRRGRMDGGYMSEW